MPGPVRLRAPLAAALLVSLATAVAGCAGAGAREAPEVSRDPEVLALAKAGPPLVFTVAVASPIVGDGSVPAPPTAGAERAVSPRRVDRPAMQAQIAAGLRATGLFRAVDTVKPSDMPRDKDEQRRRLALGAREVRANFALVTRVRVHEVAFLGLNGWWAPSAVLCATLWFPTFWFPDEDWAGSVEIEGELVDARTEKVVWGPRVARGRAEASFDDFDRGWDLFGPWGIPLFPRTETLGIGEQNWRAVDRALMPAARAQAEKRLLVDLCGYLRRVPVKIEGAEPQSLALVVGVDRGGPGVPVLSGAEADARAVAKLLEDPRVGAVPAANLRLLTGEQATRAAVLEFLTNELARTAAADQAVIYFAGYGAALRDAGARPDEPDKGKPYGYRKMLVAADTDPADLTRTAISLEEVAAALDRAPARRILVVLDCSFGGDVAGRTLPQARPAAGDALSRAFLERLSSRPGRFVLCAADPAETAEEYASESRGIYTMLLEQGLRELAVAHADGRVSLPDLVAYLEERVPPTSSLLGQRQDPMFFGDASDAAAVIMADRTRKVAGK